MDWYSLFTSRVCMKKGSFKVPAEEIGRLYREEKLSGYKISKRLGVSICSVYWHLRYQKVQFRSLSIYDISAAQLTKLYLEDGLTIKKIADGIGCVPNTVRGHLIRHGINRRPACRASNRIISPQGRIDLSTLEIGSWIKITTVDNEHPGSSLPYQAEKLGIRIVIRRFNKSTFIVIRTPLLNYEQIRQMIDSGLSIGDAAREFRSTHGTINRILLSHHN